MSLQTTWLTSDRVGAAFGFSAVALGAFGAHALKGRLGPEAMGWFQTGVQYHLAHALAILVTRDHRWFAPGIVLFSGSLYAMALGGPRALGMLTPLGGVAFLLGWGVVFRRGR